ncbi:PLP-dependent transferase [Cupriavidus basilensis]
MPSSPSWISRPASTRFPPPPIAVPLWCSATWPSCAHRATRSTTYWRYGLHATPTSEALCQHLALLEGARHTLLLPSGLAAISLVYFALLKSGDDVLVPDNVSWPEPRPRRMAGPRFRRDRALLRSDDPARALPA